MSDKFGSDDDAVGDFLASLGSRGGESAPLTRRQAREAAERAAQQEKEPSFTEPANEPVEYEATVVETSFEAAQVVAHLDQAPVAAHFDEAPAELPQETEIDVPEWVNPFDQEETAAAPPRRRRGCLVGFLIILVLIGGIAAGGIWVWNTYGDRILEQIGLGGSKDFEPGMEGDPVFVKIVDGDSGCTISEMLFESGVTKRSDTVCDMLIKSGENPNLYAGIYELREQMTAANALAILVNRENALSVSAIRDQALRHASAATATALSLDAETIASTLPFPFAEGGFLIGDSEYFDTTAMDQQEMSAFFASDLPACEGNDCLANSVKSHSELPANAFCEALPAASGQDVAGILVQIAQACGINPKLLVVALNKQLRLDMNALATSLTTSIADGGNLISNADFYNGTAMNASEIQDFLAKQVSVCDDGSTCLKDFTSSYRSRGADSYCGSLSAGTDESAATTIAKVAVACGISPRVLMIMLEKEQQLITSTNPSKEQFDRAMGYACPDTGEGHSANCDTAFAGFGTQVYYGARQMQLYTKNPNSYQYRANQTNTIQWHPSPACGTSRVFIQNQATANLYIYTPYRPNIASLAAGWGSGDACSTYGNRNFHGLYVSWFAPEKGPFLGTPTQVATCTTPPASEVRSSRGSFVVTGEDVFARIAPSDLCGLNSEPLIEGDRISVTGVYGAWSTFSMEGTAMWVLTSALVAAG